MGCPELSLENRYVSLVYSLSLQCYDSRADLLSLVRVKSSSNLWGEGPYAMGSDLTVTVFDKGVCDALQPGILCQQRVKLENIFAYDRARGCTTQVTCYGQGPLINFGPQRPAHELI